MAFLIRLRVSFLHFLPLLVLSLLSNSYVRSKCQLGLALVSTASTGGSPVADGGGVRPCSDAETDGVSQCRGEEAARPADGSGRPAV